MIKRKSIIAVLTIIILSLTGCFTIGKSYKIVFNLNENDIQYVYQDMSKKQIYKLFGLPHIEREDTLYYGFESGGLLELKMQESFLKDAVYYFESSVNRLDMKKASIKKNNMYYGISVQVLTNDEVKFITSPMDSELLQSMIGVPHKSEPYRLENGFSVTIYIYEMENGNELCILFTSTGAVGRAWVRNANGDTIETLIFLE